MKRAMTRAVVMLAATTSLACAAAPAHAADSNSLMATVPGKGEVTINGSRLVTDKVVYFYFANNGRTSFSVFTDAGAIGFSGDVDARPEPHLYSLTVDSIVRTRTGKDTDRTPATGKCDLRYGDSQMMVTSIDCTVTAEGGPSSLHFTGNGQPATVTPLPDTPPPSAPAQPSL